MQKMMGYLIRSPESMAGMNPKEILEMLRANEGKLARITFRDGIIQTVLIDGVDSEGFLHSGQDGTNPKHFWTRFDEVLYIEKPD
jgi:hypothetical protein